MDTVDTLVVGAGVVGLACARALALSGREVWVLEAAPAMGTGVSARNSEVIHAGIYYRPGSLKGALCVRGREQLYAYCAARGVAQRNCGKLIVAPRVAGLPRLEEVQRRAAGNGIELQWLAGAQARALEPALRCAAALLSPTTGIVDSHGLMLALQGDLENAGGMVVCNTLVEAADIDEAGVVVHARGAAPIRTSLLVNCAALGAQRLARAMHGFPADQVPPLHYARGCYFSLCGRAPFDRLIYPIPEAAGLGVHLTLDLGGQARFGPDVEWIDRVDYTVDPRRADGFYAAIRSYWPALPYGALQPAYAGIRPRIQGPGEPARDFMITGPADHGVAGVIQLFGIESPGLTAALAIADHVAALARAAER